MTRPGLVLAAAAFGLGLLFAFAFPPWGWTTLGCIALCGLCVCVERAQTAKTAFAVGYSFGAGQFLINFFWIANAFAVREGFSYAQGLVAVIALALAVALYPGFASALAHRLSGHARAPWAFAFTFAGGWLLAEWLRGVLFTGFPWNPVGAMWGDSLHIAQFARVGGVYGLSAITVLAAGLFAAFFKAGSLRQRLLTMGLGVIVTIGVYVHGLTVMQVKPQPRFDDLELLLVQANIPQSEKWDRMLLAEHVQAHIDLSNTPSNLGTRRIVIWPETAYPYLIERYQGAQRELQRALGPQTTLLFGANRFAQDGGQRSARNSLFILQNGALVDRYDKVHLVPFGEYVPLASLLGRLGIQSLVDALDGFTKGPRVHLLQAQGVPAFAPMICYEGIFPDHLARLQARPQWILNISNDAWFGNSSGPPQHLNLVRFRAIEQGISVVRATGTGITAVIDAYGRDTARLPAFEAAVLSTGLPKGLKQPPVYARFGAGITIGICLILLTFGVLTTHLVGRVR